jgi:hypothetical protein
VILIYAANPDDEKCTRNLLAELFIKSSIVVSKLVMPDFRIDFSLFGSEDKVKSGCA